MAVRGPIARSDLPALSERVCEIFARHPGCIVYCDVSEVPADAVTVEAIARLQLVARRNRCRVILRQAGEEVRELVALMGLTEVLSERP